MKMMAISSPHVREPKSETWSNCKIYGNHVYISGMTAHDLAGNVVGDGSMYDQSKRTFEKIKHLVEAAGGTMNDVIKVNIYVTDITEREEAWRARAEFFTGNFPAATLVEVSALATPELKVEIEAQAFLGAAEE